MKGLGFFIALFFIAILWVVLSGGGGTFLYPWSLIQEGATAILPVYQWISVRIVAWLLVLGFIYLLLNLLSIWFRSKDMALLVTVIFLASTYLFLTNTSFYYLHPFAGLFDIGRLLTSGHLLYYGIGIFALYAVLLLIYGGYSHKILSSGSGGRKHRCKAHSYAYRHSAIAYMYTYWRSKMQNQNVKRILLFVATVFLALYGFISYRTDRMKTEFQNDRIQMIAEDEERNVIQKAVYKIGMANVERSFREQYEPVKDQYASFEDWFQEHDPRYYDEMMTHMGGTDEITIYEDALTKLGSGQFGREDILNYRKEIYDIKEANRLNTSGGYLDLQYQASREQNTLIEERNATPHLKGDYLNTRYEEQRLMDAVKEQRLDEVDNLKQAMKRNERYDDSLLSSLYLLGRSGFGVLLILLLVLALATSLSEDRQEPSRREELYMLQGQDPRRWFMDKVRTNFFIIMIWVFLLSIGLLAIILPLGGWGEANYPILYYDSQRIGELASYSGNFIEFDAIYYHFANIGRIALRLVMSYGAMIFFMVSWLSFLSLKVKQHALLLLLTVLTLGLGCWLSQQLVGQSWLVFTPFIYLNTASFVDGWYSQLYNIPHYQLTFGAMVQVLWGLALFISSWLLNSYFVSRRKRGY